MEKEKPTALSAAFSILGRRARSVQELRTALARKGYEAPEVEGAVARCQELGYIDDSRYALSLARDLSRGRKLGDWAIENRLARRGISSEVAKAAVSALSADADSATEEERARSLLKRKFPTPPSDPRERDRAVRFLRSRGFGWAIIGRVLPGRGEEEWPE